MNELNIKLTGEKNLGNATILIDGAPITLKQNEFKNLTCNYQTEKDKVKVEVIKYLDVGGVWWFITQLFFFIISVFGILDVYHKNRCYYVEFAIEVDLKQNGDLTLRCNAPKNEAKAIDVETDLIIEEKANRYMIDEKAKKTFKNLLISKIFLAVAILVVVIVILIV